METVINNYTLFTHEHILVKKTAVIGRLPERREILLKRHAEVLLFDNDLIYREQTLDINGQKIENFDLHKANTLITVLDRFIGHQVTSKKVTFWLGTGEFSHCTRVKGTVNLCLSLENSEPPQELYLTPFEAYNLKNCLYHVLGFLASVA